MDTTNNFGIYVNPNNTFGLGLVNRHEPDIENGIALLTMHPQELVPVSPNNRFVMLVQDQLTSELLPANRMANLMALFLRLRLPKVQVTARDLIIHGTVTVLARGNVGFSREVADILMRVCDGFLNSKYMLPNSSLSYDELAVLFGPCDASARKFWDESSIASNTVRCGDLKDAEEEEEEEEEDTEEDTEEEEEEEEEEEGEILEEKPINMFTCSREKGGQKEEEEEEEEEEEVEDDDEPPAKKQCLP